MNYSFLFRTDASIICICLFAGSILMVMAGKLTRNKLAHDGESETKGGVNALLGALFGMWAFILAFNFSNSATRFEKVRDIIIDEANIMRNVILRSDFLPDSMRNDFRADLKTFLEARIAYYDDISDFDKFEKSKKDAEQTGKILVKKIIQVSHRPDMNLTAQNMFNSLTGLFDIAVKRDSLLQAGIPEPIQYMLFFLALAISFIGGFTTPVMNRKEWIIITGFALLAITIIYITLDMGRPMRGFIRPDIGQERIIKLRTLF